MLRNLCTLAVVLGLSSPVAAELKINDVKIMYGPLGPERPNLIVAPGDLVFFTFNATGVQVGKDGKADLSLQIKLFDKDDKSLLNSSSRINIPITLGNNQLPCVANVNLGLNITPGEYTVKIVANDNLARESVSLERKLTCKEAGFRIARPTFSYDPEGKIPAAAGGFVGQTLFFHLLVIGADRSKKKIEVSMDVQTLDKQGKELMTTPISTRLETSDPAQVAKAEVVNFNGYLSLTRAGEFVLRLRVRDEISGQTATFELPLRVYDP